MGTVTHTELNKHLPLLGVGKVRELYELNSSELLFVTTDRISAYDIIMFNAIAGKGCILTQLSKYWFDMLQQKLPNLKHHLLSVGLPEQVKRIVSPDTVRTLDGRSMVVKRVRVLPIESIVRGYITGSAWSSYQRDGSFCGIPLPPGLKESQKLEHPIWTPSTKAEKGGKDENISQEEAAKIVGSQWAEQMQTLSLAIYNMASTFAAERGIIIADTKFEFGVDESLTPPSLTLIDELLTPDSSRFWNGRTYEPGRSQDSFDKQYLRGQSEYHFSNGLLPLIKYPDWLTRSSLKGKEDVIMPQEVMENTANRYQDAFQILVGRPWEGK